MTSSQTSMFVGQDFTFEDIFSGGALGGKPAVASYLDIRTRQLTRSIALEQDGTVASKRMLLGIAAFQEARDLLHKLS